MYFVVYGMGIVSYEVFCLIVIGFIFYFVDDVDVFLDVGMVILIEMMFFYVCGFIKFEDIIVVILGGY